MKRKNKARVAQGYTVMTKKGIAHCPAEVTPEMLKKGINEFNSLLNSGKIKFSDMPVMQKTFEDIIDTADADFRPPSDPKPEPVSDPKPASKSEPKPEPVSDPKPASKSEPKPKTEPASDPKPESEEEKKTAGGAKRKTK